MTLSLSLVLLSGLAAVAVALPHSASERAARGPRAEFESSGGGAEEPIRGMVKVLQLDPRSLTQSGLFRRGLTPRRVPSLSSRLSFPAFLSRGRPAQAPSSRARVSPLNHLNPGSPSEADVKKKQGLQMWQRAIDKGEAASVSLPVQLKEAKQTCAAVPFVQRVTAPGCSTVTVHNRLCFGQCSSLFVPPDAEFAGSAAAAAGSPLLRHRAPCSRCGPSKARTGAVPLLCAGGRVLQKRALVVEECKCETSREERSAEAAAAAAAASELL